MTSTYEEFIQVITSSYGRIPKRYKRSYFAKVGKAHVFDALLALTDFLESPDTTISERLYCISNGITKQTTCKECGKPALFIHYEGQDKLRYSDFCSKTCSSKSSIRFEKISSGHNKITKEVKQKIGEARKQTMIRKYGHAYNSQRPEIKPRLCSSLKKTNPSAYDSLSSFEWLRQQYVVLERTAVDIASELGIDYTTVLSYCRKYGFEIRKFANYSLIEREISDYINSLGFLTILNDRTTISPNEIDILVPDKMLAIELNGMYWHSFDSAETKEQRERHLAKTNEIRCKGLDCLQFFESEWNQKPELVKSMIASRLGIQERIYARKCVVKEVDYKESLEFLRSNHLQGECSSALRYGLYHEGVLVSLMTFGKPRARSRTEDFELIRFCNLSGKSVLGGASKLFSHFVTDHNPSSVLSYSNSRYSKGDLYETLGFKEFGETDVGYYWTDKVSLIRRENCQKHKLGKFLGEKFDPTKSESQNMFAAGYRRIWDCGHKIFVWTSR